MRAEAIFFPVTILAFWTGLVLLLTGLRRVRAVSGGRLRARDFRLGESPEVPPDVAVTNRNYMNLLEMPVLFYVACVSLFVMRWVDGVVIALAWIYVALRLLHSAIHLTYNNVRHRFFPFAASNVLLLAIWIVFFCRLLRSGRFPF
jgi:hypothetical protein